MGSKNLSRFVSTTFLAAWHGFHSGYYVVFLCEFMLLAAEQDFRGLVKQWPTAQALIKNPVVRLLLVILGKILTVVLLVDGLIAFGLLHSHKYLVAIPKVPPFLLTALWPIVKIPLEKMLKDSGMRSKEQ